jgi:hypothetical protein
MWHKIILAILKFISPGFIAIIEDAKLANEKSTEQITKAADMIKIAEQSINDLSSRNFTQLDIFDQTDEGYLLALKEIWDSKQFAFFIDMLKHQCIVRIMQEDEKVGIEMQGILKGMDYIMKNLYVKNNAYTELKNIESGKQNITNEI